MTEADRVTFRAFGIDVDAEEMPPPEMMQENCLAWEVFDLCQDQVIVAGFGTIIGIYDSAIELAMDRLGVTGFLERIATVKKVKAIAKAIYVDRQERQKDVNDEDAEDSDRSSDE